MSNPQHLLGSPCAVNALLALILAVSPGVLTVAEAAADERTFSQVATETRLPWPCILVEDPHAFIQLDRDEVAAIANRHTPYDDTMANHLLRRQEAGAADLLGASAASRLQGCAWVASRELRVGRSFVIQRVMEGRATIIEKPSGAILPFVTVVRRGGGADFGYFWLPPDNKPMLWVAPTFEISPPKASSRPDSGITRSQGP
ncbi:hypothetical protein [Roseateles sp. P5_E11]